MPSATVTVRVQPGARKDQVVGYTGGVLRVKVAAPPVEGRANEALAAYVASLLGARARQVSIIKGPRARQKVLRVEGLEQRDVDARLAGLLAR